MPRPIALLLAAAAVSIATPLSAKTPAHRIACETVTGDLQLFDGTPSARITLRPSKRVVGVEPLFVNGDETFHAPARIRAVASFDSAVRGRFRICPRERRVAGRMQTVWIQSGVIFRGRARR